MKTCPVCGARCFDDMDVCYGCMHRFRPDGVAPAPQAATVFGQAADPAAYQSAPSTSRPAGALGESAPSGQVALAAPPGAAAGEAPAPQASWAPTGAPSAVGAPSGAPASSPLPRQGPKAAERATTVARPSGLEGAEGAVAALAESHATAGSGAPFALEPSSAGPPVVGACPRLDVEASEGTDGGLAPSPGAPAQSGAPVHGTALVSQPISLGALGQGATFQLVVTLRPCPPASAGEGA